MIMHTNLTKVDLYYKLKWHVFAPNNAEPSYNYKNKKNKDKENKIDPNYGTDHTLNLQKPDKIIENILAGILILKREITISELLSDINSALLSKNIEVDTALLNKMLRNINQSMNISLKTPQPEILYCEINNISYNSKFHLDFEENVEIIPTILGFLRINRKSSIRKISNNFSRSDGDILRFLSILAYNGVIDARIIDGICFIKMLHNTDTNIPLQYENRIIYGMLKNEKSVNIGDIMRIFDISKKDAENLLFDFNSDTELEIEISRGGEIIVSKLPQIPLLTQLQDMPIINQEILGILITHNKLRFDMIQEIWGLNEYQLKAVIYELIGTGVVREIKVDKKEFSLIKLNKLPLPIPYTDLKDKKLIDIIKYIDSNDEISIDHLSKKFDTDKHQILKYITRVVGLGYFPDAEIKSFIFIKGSELKQLKIIYRCNCDNNSRSIFCDDCGKQKLTCSVCNGKIEKSEQILQCPHCEYPNHIEHIISWIEIKSICPICKNIINADKMIKGVIS